MKTRKYFEIVDVNTKTGEEWTEWGGLDAEQAKAEKKKAFSVFDARLTDSEKECRAIEYRVYSLPDDTDFNDEMEVAVAICGCVGYDCF